MVVKNAFGKIIFREFRKSFGRFAAIFGIVALGVGFLSGLIVTTPDMRNSVDEYYDKNNMADIFIKSTMGVTNEDLKTVSEMDKVHQVMPANVLDMIVDTSSRGTLVTRIYGLPLLEDKADINRLELIEGRMPEKSNEVLVERSGQYLADIAIGSIISISPENEDYENIDDYFDVLRYEVVGVVGNTFHFSLEREMSNVGSGRLGAIIYTDESSFSMDSWTDLYIVVEDAIEMDSFSDEYGLYINKVVEDLEGISDERSEIRYNEIKEKAEKELADGWEEYNDGKAEADQELSDAWRDILKGRLELADALKDLHEGEKELEDGRASLKKEIAEAKKEIADGEKELADAKLDLQKAELELVDAKIKLRDGEKDYYQGYLELIDGKSKYEDGLEDYKKGEEKYTDGVKEIEDGKRELLKGERKLERGKRELLKGERDYEAGVQELKRRKQELLVGVSLIAEKFGIIGYNPQNLIETIQGQTILKNTIAGARIQLETKKLELENNILGLNMQIQYLQSQINTATDPEIIAGYEAELEVAQMNLIEANAGLTEINNQLAQLPNPDQLIGGWNQILNGEKELQSAGNKLNIGWAEYYDGLADLKAAEKEIKDGEKKLKEAKKELDNAKRELRAAEKEIKDGEKEIADARKKLDDGWREYNEGISEVTDGWKEYEDGLEKLVDARLTLDKEETDAQKELDDAEIEIKDGWKEYNDGIAELEDGEKEYHEEKAKAEEELAEAYDELKDAEKEIRELDFPEWYVLDRESNMSYVSFQLNSEKVAAIAKVFPIFFYFVAALVSLTTMTRMIEEERTLIGLLKALGFKRIAIVGKYVIYCGLASILGSLAGQLVGFKLIPKVLWNTYGVMYHLPPFITEYNTKIALIASGAAVISTVGVTIYIANETLREKPATLMLPKAPKAGKRILLEKIGPLWRRMSFNVKSTARNIFRYKKYFYMTVVGISGCTALLLTGFGLKDSIGHFAGTQFDEIFKYQVNVELDEKELLGKNLDSVFEDVEGIGEYTGIYTDKGIVRYKGDTLEGIVMVFQDPEDLTEFIEVRNRESQELIDSGEEYVIITEKLSEVLGISIGETIVYEDSDNNRREFVVTDITENYILNYIYMDLGTYQSVFGNREINGALARTEEMDSEGEDKLVKELLLKDPVKNAEFVSQTRTTFDNLIKSIDYIVIVIIVASGLLAFIVLYNLTNININERKKELATFKVLGFHNKEVSAHIFRETSVLTFFGIMVGLLLGVYLHGFIVKTVENTNFMFGRDISILSYIYSAVITLIFSLIVNMFMSRKIRKIEMVESMKANE